MIVYLLVLSANTEILSLLPRMIVVGGLWVLKPLPVISNTVPRSFAVACAATPLAGAAEIVDDLRVAHVMPNAFIAGKELSRSHNQSPIATSSAPRFQPGHWVNPLHDVAGDDCSMPMLLWLV